MHVYINMNCYNEKIQTYFQAYIVINNRENVLPNKQIRID